MSAEVEELRRAAAEHLLTVWTVDPTPPRHGEVHLNRYTMSVAQALELIAGSARGRWIEEVVYIEAGDAADVARSPQQGRRSLAAHGRISLT